MLAFSNDYYGFIVMATQSVELFCAYKEKNISKNKVCAFCGMQRTQLNNYCKNKISRVDLAILGKLCECLECTPNDIIKTK